MPAVLNYTTKVPATRTLGEVQSVLATHGADAIGLTYADGEATGLRFQIDGYSYALPVDVEAMHRALLAAARDGHMKASPAERKRYTTPEHARRVAWRVIKDWLEAQLALVAAQQATLGEVMLPYLLNDAGRALREDWRSTLALEAPRDRDQDGPHSRACGMNPHDHGRRCSSDCPTCEGRPR